MFSPGTGWLNVLGQFATTAGVGALLANHIANMWLLGNGHVFTSVELLLTYASACSSHLSLRRLPGHWELRSKTATTPTWP